MQHRVPDLDFEGAIGQAAEAAPATCIGPGLATGEHLPGDVIPPPAALAVDVERHNPVTGAVNTAA